MEEKILHQIPLSGSEKYSEIVVFSVNEKLDIAIRTTENYLWKGFVSFDDISFPQRERTEQNMKNIADLFAYNIKDNISTLTHCAGKLLNNSFKKVMAFEK